MQDDFGISPIDPTESSRILKQEQAQAKKLAVNQEMSQIVMSDFTDEAAFSPTIMARRFESAEEKMRRRLQTEKEKDASNIEEEIPKIEKIEQTEALAEQYEDENPELDAAALSMLRVRLKDKDSAEDILKRVLESYPDHSLADSTLDYLSKTTTGEILAKVKQAKESLNETFGREIRAGHNITKEAREFSSQGLGSPTGLRDLYRDLTGNPRDASTLFTELSDKFTYESMNKVIDFVLHSLGADLKSKGPSIARSELHLLMSEARNLTAVLGVYRFFESRMNLISEAFQRTGSLLASHITFQLLAKLFVLFLKERYPSMDKAFQLSLKLGISSDLLAQIILLTQMRDAVRGIAPRLFRSEQHKYDVLMSFIEALEKLDERLEEEEEEEEEKEKED